MSKTITMTFEVAVSDDADVEEVADALDRVLETGLSTPDIMDGTGYIACTGAVTAVPEEPVPDCGFVGADGMHQDDNTGKSVGLNEARFKLVEEKDNGIEVYECRGCGQHIEVI